MLNSTLKTGDLLYYQGPEKPDGTHDATHVTMWVGDVIPGTSVPLVMDSHGGAIQVGVDSDGNPTGLVAPSGPQLRPWFIPNPPPPYPKQKDDPNPPANESDANYFYFNNFFHVVRLDALNK